MSPEEINTGEVNGAEQLNNEVVAEVNDEVVEEVNDEVVEEVNDEVVEEEVTGLVFGDKKIVSSITEDEGGYKIFTVEDGSTYKLTPEEFETQVK